MYTHMQTVEAEDLSGLSGKNAAGHASAMLWPILADYLEVT